MKNKMRFLTTKQARRRGVAIELAISVLMITFALSSLIVSIALHEIDKMEQSNETLLQRNELDQVGQNFCAAVADGVGANLTAWAESVAQYWAVTTVAADGSTVTLKVHPAEDKNQGNATVLLQVELQKQGTGYTVTRWAYR